MAYTKKQRAAKEYTKTLEAEVQSQTSRGDYFVKRTQEEKSRAELAEDQAREQRDRCEEHAAEAGAKVREARAATIEAHKLTAEVLSAQIRDKIDPPAAREFRARTQAYADSVARTQNAEVLLEQAQVALDDARAAEAEAARQMMRASKVR